MECIIKIMAISTGFLLCLLITSSNGENIHNRISKRDVDGNAALLSDFDTAINYRDEREENVERVLRRSLLLKAFWNLCEDLDACPVPTDVTRNSEYALPPRSSRGKSGHLFWRTGMIMPPKRNRK